MKTSQTASLVLREHAIADPDFLYTHRTQKVRYGAPSRKQPAPEAGLVQHCREEYGITQPALMRLTGFSARSVAKWAAGEAPSPKQHQALIAAERLLKALARVIKPAQIGKWLSTPSQAFGGSSPLHVIERGEVDRLWRMLYDLESGQPG
jgi:transcriptional regulator with XRE-family HTH domain